MGEAFIYECVGSLRYKDQSLPRINLPGVDLCGITVLSFHVAFVGVSFLSIIRVRLTPSLPHAQNASCLTLY